MEQSDGKISISDAMGTWAMGRKGNQNIDIYKGELKKMQRTIGQTLLSKTNTGQWGTTSKQPVILANDPSITGWGWAVICTKIGKVMETGCIKTAHESKKRRIRKGDDTVRRVSEICQELLKIVRKYKVELILSELPHGSQSAVAAVMIGIVTGMVQTFGDCFDIPVEWYSEGDSKKALLNKRAATKKETIDAVKKLYDVPWTGIGYKDEAVADAMSIYHAATRSSALVRMLKMKN